MLVCKLPRIRGLEQACSRLMAPLQRPSVLAQLDVSVTSPVYYVSTQGRSTLLGVIPPNINKKIHRSLARALPPRVKKNLARRSRKLPAWDGLFSCLLPPSCLTLRREANGNEREGKQQHNNKKHHTFFFASRLATLSYFSLFPSSSCTSLSIILSHTPLGIHCHLVSKSSFTE